MFSLYLLSLSCDFHAIFWFGIVSVKFSNSYLRKKKVPTGSEENAQQRLAGKCSMCLVCLAFFRSHSCQWSVIIKEEQSSLMSTEKKSCLPFLSIAPLPRQAGLQPEASRQNLTATLQNVSSSYQCIHNS